MARLVKERRGAVTVQMALFVPILVIILIGSFEVWKVSYIRQVLNDAAYQGLRLMVSQANAPKVDGIENRVMCDEVEKLVRRYVATQAFPPLDRNDADGNVMPSLVQDPAYHEYDSDVIRVVIKIDGQALNCSERSPDDPYIVPPVSGTTISVEVSRPYVVGAGTAQDESGWMPFLGRAGRITATASGYVLGEPSEDLIGEY